MAIGTYLSIITLNVSMKGYKVADWKENLYAVYKRITSQLKHSLKVRE